MSMVKNEDFKITKGENKLKLYQFHSKVAKHYFLFSLWNLYSSQSKNQIQSMTGFNVGCIDEIDIFKLKNVNIMMVKIIL